MVGGEPFAPRVLASRDWFHDDEPGRHRPDLLVEQEAPEVRRSGGSTTVQAIHARPPSAIMGPHRRSAAHTPHKIPAETLHLAKEPPVKSSVANYDRPAIRRQYVAQIAQESSVDPCGLRSPFGVDLEVDSLCASAHGNRRI